MSPMSEFFSKALGDSPIRIVALDPGETTGACLFQGSKLLDARQIPTKHMPEAALLVRNYIRNWETNPASGNGGPIDAVVMENYAVYSWKADEHSWQTLHTPRLIGGIELVCYDFEIPLTKQMAQQAKGFCTDDKLKAWGFYQEGMKHARDAIRHACYYLLFTHAKVHKPKGVK